MTDQSKRLPGNRSHLERLLTEWASGGEERVTSGRLRHLVGVMVIIQTLEGLKDERGVERIGFKGGAALELRFGFRARASRDLDGAYAGDVAEAIELINGAVGRGWNGFTGGATEGEPIENAGFAVPPVRFRVKLLYKQKRFITVPVELSPAEGRSLERLEVLPSAVSLEPVQLDGFDAIPFMPIRYQVAQKLHACTEDLGEEQPNQRARELVDLLLIEELAIREGDLGGIRDACVETFGLRAKQAWPPEVVVWPGWEEIWRRLAQDEDLAYSVFEAAERVQALVKRIDAPAR